MTRTGMNVIVSFLYLAVKLWNVIR